MASTPPTPASTEPEADISFAPAGAGAAFQAEMAATNFLLGYWKWLAASVALVLVSVLFYGLYTTNVEKTQRDYSRTINTIEGKLVAPLPELPGVIAQGGEGVDAAALQAVGDELLTFAASASGPSKAEAMLKAAEVYRLAGKPDLQRKALEYAHANGRGVLAYVSASGLSNLDLAEGRGDEAVKHLRDLMAKHDGFLAQQAALDLGLALEHLDRKPEAVAVYDDFVARWADSARAPEAISRRERIASGE